MSNHGNECAVEVGGICDCGYRLQEEEIHTGDSRFDEVKRERDEARRVLTDLRQGGPWLGAVRKWLQWNTNNGDTVKWGSAVEIEPPLTARQVEEIGAVATAGAAEEIADLKARIETLRSRHLRHDIELTHRAEAAEKRLALVMELASVVRRFGHYDHCSASGDDGHCTCGWEDVRALLRLIDGAQR